MHGLRRVGPEPAEQLLPLHRTSRGDKSREELAGALTAHLGGGHTAPPPRRTSNPPRLRIVSGGPAAGGGRRLVAGRRPRALVAAGGRPPGLRQAQGLVEHVTAECQVGHETVEAVSDVAQERLRRLWDEG